MEGDWIALTVGRGADMQMVGLICPNCATDEDWADVTLGDVARTVRHDLENPDR